MNHVGYANQERYEAILVEKESYLPELSRYIVLNSVRAGRVKDVERWPGNSYSAMIGKVNRPEWLQTDGILGQFGKRAVAAYRDFVRSGVGLPSVWNDLRGQIEEFVETMQQHVQSDSHIREIPRVQRKQRPSCSNIIHRSMTEMQGMQQPTKQAAIRGKQQQINSGCIMGLSVALLKKLGYYVFCQDVTPLYCFMYFVKTGPLFKGPLFKL